VIDWGAKMSLTSKRNQHLNRARRLSIGHSAYLASGMLCKSTSVKTRPSEVDKESNSLSDRTEPEVLDRVFVSAGDENSH
jgi:hypothetical protein